MNLNTKLTCPKCGAESPMERFKLSEEILEISKLAAKFGRAWPWCAEYLDCFRSDVDKPLTPSRMKILVGEVLEYVEKRGFTYDRKFHAIRPEALFEALRNVALLNKRGFLNHNYLKKVAININLKMIQKEEEDQRARLDEAMNRGRDPQGPERVRKILTGLEKDSRQ